MNQGTARYQPTPRVLLFLKREEHYLFIEGAPRKWWAGKVNGIGGSVEAGETIIEAARRETREETGLEAQALHLAAIVTVISEPPVLLFVYVGELGEGEVQETEEGTFRWLSEAELENPDVPTFEDFPFLWEQVKEVQGGDAPRYLVFDYRDGFAGREKS
jgi:8-oxo-dGTP diphosphatase